MLGKVQGEAVQGHSKGEAEEKGRLTDSEDGWGVENLRNPRSGRPLIRFPPDVAHEYMPLILMRQFATSDIGGSIRGRIRSR